MANEGSDTVVMEISPNLEFMFSCIGTRLLYNIKFIVSLFFFFFLTYMCRIKVKEGSVTEIMAQDINWYNFDNNNNNTVAAA